MPVWPQLLASTNVTLGDISNSAYIDQWIKVIDKEFLEQTGDTIDMYHFNDFLPDTQPETTWIAAGGNPNPGGLTPSLSLASISLKRLATQVYLDVSTSKTANNPDDVMRRAIAMAYSYMKRNLGFNMIYGDGLGNNLAGLESIVNPAQIYTPAAGAGFPPTMQDIRFLIHTITAEDDYSGSGADYLIMAPQALRFFADALQTSGSLMQTAFSSKVGHPVGILFGCPVYLAQITTTEEYELQPNTTSIYACKSGKSGVKMFIFPEGDNNGIMIHKIPGAFDAALTGYLLEWRGAIYCKNFSGLARLAGCSVAGVR